MGETTLVTKDNMTGTGRKHVVIEVSHKTPLVVHDDDQTSRSRKAPLLRDDMAGKAVTALTAALSHLMI